MIFNLLPDVAMATESTPQKLACCGRAPAAVQTIFRRVECPSLRLAAYREAVAWKSNRNGKLVPLVVLLLGVTALAACSTLPVPKQPPVHQVAVSPAGITAAGGVTPRANSNSGIGGDGKAAPSRPAPLRRFPGTRPYPDEGVWQPAGRLIDGKPAVYETLLVPPGGAERAGIAWMDTTLLSARLYSGSLSPGGGPYKYTAPVTRTAARALVAAFNGGFKMADAHGGYYTEGRMVRPLVRGSASLVIYDDGSVTVGAWGTDVALTPSVAAVRQNLFPLVIDGRPSARASTRIWRVWGGTCPCGDGRHGTEHQWRSGLGVTVDGALVYVAGPLLDPQQVADLLVRAGAVRGMQLDINPSWPVFASFKPAAADGLAAPSNGARLIDTHRGPATFFDPAYARDFITMSARPRPGRR
jgi:hypothetical protein